MFLQHDGYGVSFQLSNRGREFQRVFAAVHQGMSQFVGKGRQPLGVVQFVAYPYHIFFWIKSSP
jgi:hypothetical protein